MEEVDKEFEEGFVGELDAGETFIDTVLNLNLLGAIVIFTDGKSIKKTEVGDDFVISKLQQAAILSFQGNKE